MGCVMCGHDADAAISLRFELFVARDAKSDNGRITNAGASRFAYAKDRDEWSRLLRAAMLELPGVALKPAVRRRRLTVVRRYCGTQKLRDRDNLAASYKPAIDALVRHGLLVDDSPRNVEGPHYQQERCGKGQGGSLFVIEEFVL